MTSSCLLRRTLAALAVTASFCAVSTSAAQSYPERPITVVVGYPAGGSVDLTARLLSEELATQLGQSIVVENAGGAGGTIGAQRVARANPDGYTLLVGSTNEMVIAGMINSAVRYDSAKDFTPIGMIASQPMLLAASKTSGVTSAQEYLDKLKSGEPGQYNFGSSGIGTTLHLAGEMINESTGTKAEHVPYRGVAPLVTDLISGQLNYGVLVLSSGLPQVKGDKIVALGVTEKKRSAVAPDIPSLSETPGFEQVDINVWFGLYGPAKLPEPVVTRLNEALTAVLKSDAFRTKMSESGATLYEPGIDGARFLASETEKYGRLVKLANIEPN
ncbi:Bug family tripartite tricarboxylate transporter substrate binding protein [Paracandidimonas soli]|uniref:Tripartite-type tricarboxylate transporter receptor subunit TctC n=1 Tax=Paracandidimonas soli TaxID=1917182 RepID=A0A4R3URG4_9BURK|nr:tripartite tricarboxylate transporter substrate binding protein [Paracandidimonas soli]TCU92988.1 tripartite-type tricarboxylate transporter receptor subunit TctC [Paracandidimonas soli]